MVEWNRRARQAVKGAGLIGFLVGGYLVFDAADWGEALTPERIVAALESWGRWGPFVFILSMAVAVVVSPIPSLPLDVAAGAVYGPFLGTLFAVLGAEIGAVASFLIGRWLGKDLVGRLLRTDVVFCERCTDRHLMGLIVLSRLLPVFSFDIVSYGAGLTNMSLKAFAMATLVGMLPPTFALTYFGSALLEAESVWVLPGLGLIALFVVLPSWMVKHRKARWVKILQGDMGESATRAEERSVQHASWPGSCAWCGTRWKRDA